MSDKLTPQQRHHCMQQVRSRDTRPEWVVRRFLFNHGFRYRLQVKRLPGKPDIVMRRIGVCIFINGCFWHGHEGCRYFTIPKTRTEWWTEKLRHNQERDARVQKDLESLGWRVITIWECELKPARRDDTLQRLLIALRQIEAPVLLKELRKTASYTNSYSDDELLMAAEEEEEYSSYNK